MGRKASLEKAASSSSSAIVVGGKGEDEEGPGRRPPSGHSEMSYEEGNSNGSSNGKRTSTTSTTKFKDECSGEWRCPVCDTKMDSQHAFTVHIRTHNPTDHSHTCSICSKTLSSASSLDRHMLIHSGERPFKCRICNMAFTTNGNMHRHMRTHGMEQTLASAAVAAAAASTGNSSFGAESENQSHHSISPMVSPSFPAQDRNNNQAIVTSSEKKRKKKDGSGSGQKKEKLVNGELKEKMEGKCEQMASDGQGEELCMICGLRTKDVASLEKHMEKIHPGEAIQCRDCKSLSPNFALHLKHSCLDGGRKSGDDGPVDGPLVSEGVEKIGGEPSPRSSPSGFHDLTFTDFSSSKFSLIAKSFIEGSGPRHPSSPYHHFQCSLCRRSFPSWSSLALHLGSHETMGGTYCGLCRTELGTRELFLSHQMKHAAVSASSSAIKSLESFNGLRPADKEGFLALLQLQNKPIEATSQQQISAHMREELPFDYPSYYINARAKPNQTPFTFSPRIVNGGAGRGQMSISDGNGGASNSAGGTRKRLGTSGGGDLADIQSIISVTSSSNPLTGSSRCSPQAASPASPPIQSGSKRIKADSPVPADCSLKATTVLDDQHQNEDDVELDVDHNSSDGQSSEMKSESDDTEIEDGASESMMKMDVMDPSSALTGSLVDGQMVYRCPVCSLDVKSATALKRHHRSHTGSINSYSCDLCTYTSLDKSTLVRHLRTHNGERPFQCAICKYPFTTKANCERHIRKKHKKSSKQEIQVAMQYNPNMSASASLTVQNISKHNNLPTTTTPSSSTNMMMNMMNNNSWSNNNNNGSGGGSGPSNCSDMFPFQMGNHETVCKYCSVDFKYNRVLRHHLRSLHNSCARKPYTCTICKLRFSTKNNCIRHVGKQHQEIKDRLAAVLTTNGGGGGASGGSPGSTSGASNSAYSEDFSEGETSAYNHETGAKTTPSSSFPLNSCATTTSTTNSSLEALCQIAGRIGELKDGHSSPAFNNEDKRNEEGEGGEMESSKLSDKATSPPPQNLEDENSCTAMVLADDEEDREEEEELVVDTLEDEDEFVDEDEEHVRVVDAEEEEQDKPLDFTKAPQLKSAKEVKKGPKDFSMAARGLVDISENSEQPLDLTLHALDFSVKNSPPAPTMTPQKPAPIGLSMEKSNNLVNSNVAQDLRAAEIRTAASSLLALQSIVPRTPSNPLEAFFPLPAPSLLPAHLSGVTDGNGSSGSLATGPSPSFPTTFPGHSLLPPPPVSASASILNPSLVGGIYESAFPNFAAVIGKSSAAAAAVAATAAAMTGGNGASKNVRNIKCIYCTQGFTLKSNMERHIKRKHPEFARPARNASSRSNVTPTPPPILQMSGTHNKDSVSILSKNPTTTNPPPNQSSSLSNKTRAALRVVLNNKASASSTTGTLSNGSPASSPDFPDLHSPKQPPNGCGNGDEGNGGGNDLASVSSLIAETRNSSNALKEYLVKGEQEGEEEEEVEEEDEEDGRAGEDVKNHQKENKVVNGAETMEKMENGKKDEEKSLKKDVKGPLVRKRSAYTDSPNSVSCPYCTRRFPWTSSLRRHVLTHTGYKPYKCPKCPITFTTKSNCERHLGRIHGPDSRRSTSSSGSNSTSNSSFIANSFSSSSANSQVLPSTESKQQYKCTLCLNTFSTHGNLKKHYYLRHWTKTNNGPSLLRKRMNGEERRNNKKVVGQPYRCHLCPDRSFDERMSCLNHLQDSHMLFFSKEMLANLPNEEQEMNEEQMKRRKDLGADLINCALCSERFSSDEKLGRHMVIGHKLAEVEKEKEKELVDVAGGGGGVGDGSGEKKKEAPATPFKCTLCPRKFSLKNSLLRHIRTNHSLLQPLKGSSNLGQRHHHTLPPTAPTLEKGKGFNHNSLLFPMVKGEKESMVDDMRKAGEDSSDGGDLIGNLLGIQDSKMVDEMLDSADSAARILGLGGN